MCTKQRSFLKYGIWVVLSLILGGDTWNCCRNKITVPVHVASLHPAASCLPGKVCACVCCRLLLRFLVREMEMKWNEWKWNDQIFGDSFCPQVTVLRGILRFLGGHFCPSPSPVSDVGPSITQTTTWCQKTELCCDSSDAQFANGASLEANCWLQPTSTNMVQFKPLSPPNLTDNHIIVPQYNTDYNKYFSVYKLLLHFSFLVLSCVFFVYVFGGGCIASWGGRPRVREWMS